jgi:hypothetical protein
MILTTLLSAKTAAAVVGAGALVLGGGTVAAYAGVLPAGLQIVAHDVVGAPAPAGQGDDAADAPDPSKTAEPSESPDPSESPKTAATADSTATTDPTASPSAKGPDATGPARFGLCNAHQHGGLPEHSTAYQALLAAATAAAAAAPSAPTAPGTPAGTAGTPTTTTPTTDPVQVYCDGVLGITTPPAASAPSGDTVAGSTTKHGKAHQAKKSKHTSHRHGGQSGSH